MGKYYFHGRVKGFGKYEEVFAGKKDTGIQARLYSPNTGVEIKLSHDQERNVDVVEIYETDGGFKNGLKNLIACYEVKLKEWIYESRIKKEEKYVNRWEEKENKTKMVVNWNYENGR